MDKKEPLGVAIFVPTLIVYGGMERNIIALSAFLNAQAIPHHIVCFYSELDLFSEAEHSVPIIQLTRSLNPIRRAYLLAKHLRTVWCATGKLPLLFGIRGAFYMGILCMSPFALHFTDPPSMLRVNGDRNRSWIIRIRGIGARYLFRRGTRKAATVITMTERNSSEILELYGRKSLVLRQGGRPPGVIKRRSYLKTGKAVILSVSRLEASKRLDWILETAADLHNRLGQKVTVLLVGQGGEKSSLEARANQLGISFSVDFPGAVSDAELERIFDESDLFVMPAIQGYGLPALEALYRRIPVVLHIESGVSEVLFENPWAEIFSGGQQELTLAVKRMLDRIREGVFDALPTPAVPTEKEWAGQLAAACGWK